jgi:hypothetical protein
MTISISSMALRRELINSKGKKLERRKSGWERCYVELEGDVLTTWKSGGILLDDKSALKDLKVFSEPVDLVHLRFVTIQKIPEKGCLCLHFTDGMQRILFRPESEDDGRTIETWASTFHRSIRETILFDQYSTSLFIHSSRSKGKASNFTSLNQAQFLDESFSIEYKWPGMTEFERCCFSIQMKNGWKDSRIVSKRCILLWNQSKKLVKTIFAKIASISSIHLLSQDDTILVIEGEAKFLQNNSQVVPVVERVQIKPLDLADLKRLILFIRDSFEIIFPRPGILDETCQSIPMKKINTSCENSGKEVEPEQTIASLVRSKPWSQLPWIELFANYKLVNHGAARILSPIDFTLKFKEIGFCLKSESGTVVTVQELKSAQLNAGSAEAVLEGLSSMYWHHVALNEKEIK